jgi:small subunit ribosomal protein S25e
LLQKWSKGKLKEKVNNQVLFDKVKLRIHTSLQSKPHRSGVRILPGPVDLYAFIIDLLQSTYEKLMTEVPKYKMITPSVLSDRLRVRNLFNHSRCLADAGRPNRLFAEPLNQLLSFVTALQINGSLARAAIKELASQGAIKVVAKSHAQEIYTRATKEA